MNFPKRTQEIATILCQRLDGDAELSRKIVGHLKETETECNRIWHINRLSTRGEYREYVPRGEEAERWDSLVDQLQFWGGLRMVPFGFQWRGIQTGVPKDLSIADCLDIINAFKFDSGDSFYRD